MRRKQKWDVTLFAAAVLWLFVVALAPEAGYVFGNWTPRMANQWTTGNLAFLLGVIVTREAYLYQFRQGSKNPPQAATGGGGLRRQGHRGGADE